MLKNAVRILQGPCIKHPEHPMFARGYVLQGFRRLGYHNAQNVWAPRFESLPPKKQLGLGSAGALALACDGRRPVRRVSRFRLGPWRMYKGAEDQVAGHRSGVDKVSRES